MGLVGKHCTRLATLCLSQCQGLGDDVTFSVRDDSSCAPAALASMRALLGIPRALHSCAHWQEIAHLRQLSVFECDNISAVSALAVIVACGSLWRATGSIRIERCQHLVQLKVGIHKLSLRAALLG